MAEVESFCGLASLRTGAIASGWITMIMSILGIAEVIYFLSNEKDTIDGIVQNANVTGNVDTRAAAEDTQAIETIINVVVALSIILCIVWIIISILLLLGVAWNKRSLVTTWLVWDIVMVSLMGISFIRNISRVSTTTNAGVQVVINLFEIIGLIYLVAVVSNYKKSMPLPSYVSGNVQVPYKV